MAASAGVLRWTLAVLAPLAASLAAAPLAAGQEPSPIQDNSFLVEEAYNQERGVVQHISTFSRPDGGGSWLYTLTQEWPLGGIRHQLSYTLPVLNPEGSGGVGLGDIALNYRYQLAGNPEARFLAAPRGSLVVPTGSKASGRGTGELGVQINLPVTYMVAPRVAAHGNAGVTAVRRAAPVYNLGASAIWLVRPTFNVMLEGLWLSEGGEDAAWLNPGARWAFNFDGGLQIVPGFAYTVGVGPSSGDDGVFLYLSFEHPFTRR